MVSFFSILLWSKVKEIESTSGFFHSKSGMGGTPCAYELSKKTEEKVRAQIRMDEKIKPREMW